MSAWIFLCGRICVHPDKTLLERIDKGFDWLGIWYGPAGPRIAPEHY